MTLKFCYGPRDIHGGGGKNLLQRDKGGGRGWPRKGGTKNNPDEKEGHAGKRATGPVNPFSGKTQTIRGKTPPQKNGGITYRNDVIRPKNSKGQTNQRTHYYPSLDSMAE